jgi:hypothetical protein
MQTKQKLTLLILLIFLTTLCHAAVPRLITYQGKLSNKSNSKPLEGVQSINFKIYDALNGGNLLWQETQNVLVSKGIFNVNLGSSIDINLSFDKPYYLEIKIGETEIISPRQRITSSGYAISAENLEGSITADQVGSGNVSDTEFEALNGVTGNIQSQINGAAKPDYTGNWQSLSGYSANSAKNWNAGFVPSYWILQWRLNSSSAIHIIPTQYHQAWSVDWYTWHTVTNNGGTTLVYRANSPGCVIVHYWNGSSWTGANYRTGEIRVLAWK